MADTPAVTPIVPPPPPLPPAPPDPPIPGFIPSGVFIAAHPGRNTLYDAFYADERNTGFPKELHPCESFFNVFTKLDGTPYYDNATPLIAFYSWRNPLRFADRAKVLTQSFADLLRVAAELKLVVPASVKNEFDGGEYYYIFVPEPLQAAAKSKSKQKARICIFYGVGPEINLFGLRSFFKAADDCVLITVSGIEDAPVNWGVGITTGMIKELLNRAGAGGLDFTVEVMAGYSTGYRGLNETLINKLVDPSGLRRVVYLDAFYVHDDFPRVPRSSPQYVHYSRKNTQWAVDVALTASPNAHVYIYAYTGGVPRDSTGKPQGPLDDLIKSGGSDRIHFLDLELGGQGASPVADEIEKVCLARLIQGGIDDYFLARDVEADILGLVKLLPERGALGVIGRSGFINLYDWIKTGPQKAALAAFPSDRAFAMVMQKQLFSDWKIVSTKNSMPKYTRVPDKLIPGYWFRHRDFVQEICKETLLP